MRQQMAPHNQSYILHLAEMCQLVRAIDALIITHVIKSHKKQRPIVRYKNRLYNSYINKRISILKT